MNGARLRRVAAAAMLVLTAPLAAQGAIDPYFGDGGTSPFYRWSGAVGAPGRMLRREPVGAGFHADNAGVAERILYSTTDGRFGRGAIEASGLLYLPKGTVPDGGWPLLVWGHGTFGVADVCAPSWAKPNERDGTYIDSWLKRGYAVVAPDYQGLGTRGVHPYLQRRPEGYSTLDAARAALAAFPGRIANKVVLAGQSQGSGAVLNAVSVWEGYAPDVKLRAAIATALVWRAPDATSAGDMAGADSSRYLVMRMMGGGLVEGSPAPDSLLTEKGRLLREAARTSCSRALVPVVERNGITAANAVDVPPERMAAMLQPLNMPAGRLKVPIFIATGLADAAIDPGSQYRATKALCARGENVTWHAYPGVGHSATSVVALQDAIPYADAVLAGRIPPSTCANVRDPGPRQQPSPDIPFNTN